jgi:hypothetical protein
MQVKRVPIADVKASAHNPSCRTRKGEPTLARLGRSIEEIGLIYPVVVAKDMTVIDGHRRLQSCKNLGWEDIPILIVDAENADLVYADVNANSKKLTGNENLIVWLKNPRAVSKRFAGDCVVWEEKIGRKALQAIAKAGMSIRVGRTAGEIAQYVANDTPEFLLKAVKWLIEHRMRQMVDSYILMQQPPKSLFNAIKANRPLQAKYA